MLLRKIELSNFKSFNGEHWFSFENPSGLHFLTGVNAVEPELGANGAGKSSLFDAIYWCLYGKTMRNIRASNVCNWAQGSKCAVKLWLTQTDVEYEISRSWHPNHLTLNGHEASQDEIDDLIGLNARAFQYAVIIGQTNSMFFDLQPSEKLSLFGDILDLDYWIEKSSQASAEVSDLQEQLMQCDIDATKLQSRKESLEEEVATNSKLSAEFAFKQAQKKKKLDDEITILVKEQKRLVLLKKSLEKAKSTKEQEYKEYAVKFSNQEKHLKTLESKLSIVSRDIKDCDISLGFIKKELAKFNAVEDQCPHCKQKVSKQHIQQEKSKLEEQQELLQEKINSLENKEKTLIDKHIKMMHEFEALMEQLDDAREVLNNSNLLESEINNEEKITTLSLNKCEASIREIAEDRNIYQELCEKHKIEIKKLAKKLKSVIHKKDEINVRLTGTTYWVKGFREIRLLLIEEALASLELEINNYLLQLGLHDWQIKLDVEKENKSGGISKGFQVLVSSPYNSEIVPWESWSGGESQRLRLAGTMGLSNLILNRAGVQSNILVFDEPSQYLSEEGIQDMLELLSSKAFSDDKQVWLIDHRSIDYGGFVSRTTIRKTKDGSHIEGM